MNERLKVISVDYETDHTRGCDTCDYGASWLDDVTIRYEGDNCLTITVNSSDSSIRLTESDLILMVANTSTPQEIINYLKEMYKIYEGYEWVKDRRISYQWNKEEIQYILK